MTKEDKVIPLGPAAHDTEVDLLVIGSGTGMASALSAAELGLDVLVVEKTAVVGGSTARSGGAFWIPPNPVLVSEGVDASTQPIREYLQSVVGDTAPEARWQAFVDNGSETVEMLERTTPMRFFWAKYYSDYHPENPGGSAEGRTCECQPFDASVLGEERGRLRSGVMEAPVPMPVTGADYKWMNLVRRMPTKGLPRITKRVAQGVGGKVLGREYVAGGLALAAGMFAGLGEAGVPVWTNTELVELIEEDGRVVGAILQQDGLEVSVRARKGVVLAAGGFDHDMSLRREVQSEILTEDISLGAEGNTGGGISAGKDVGGETALMDQAWWFPAFASPDPKMGEALAMLAERSLPGSLMIDAEGERFINEATDYMTFGQEVLSRAEKGNPVRSMWLVFDQKFRDSYMLAGVLFPGMAIPEAWYAAGIAVKGSNPRELARAAGVPEETFERTLRRFNSLANLGEDHDFGRGNSAYDRYYGDPTVYPNPNLRALSGPLFATKILLSDLGTCGGLMTNENGQVLRSAGDAVEGLYALGNNAANVFGKAYPGAGATIGQGLVFGHIIAKHAATR